ncbi:AAA family ATPase [Sorangium sp. So ce1000]|uniref:AAA family ATPase n=1 Tax=Sorangium sp. So ce1000 TaxID=3133325 RepID=UPI003F619170
MLTRLVARGFKNLDVDVQLGPFTCIAGPNGVGKSNVFDVIAFLSALAGKPLLEAALDVRGGAGRMGDVRGLFRRVGTQSADTLHLGADMIIPEKGEDQLGQVAEASITYLRYELDLRYRTELPARPNGGLEVVQEKLTHLNLTDARKLLGFPSSPTFRESCIKGRRTSPYISTKDGFVLLHADSKGGKGGGNPRKVRAADLPRTVLSTAENATEHRTATLARREMLSWTQLHLEPSALRAPDDFTAPGVIGHNGGHLPAVLYRLAREEGAPIGVEPAVYSRVANELSRLVEQVRSVHVDADEKRQLLSIVMTDRHGTPHLASSLSDGTLRFLALAIMREEAHPRALLCLEEPENGMHPSRIPAMLGVLKDLAVDTDLAVGADNPLRQVMINTHSPSVVVEVPDDSLLVAKLVPGPDGVELATLLPLQDTWRVADDTVAKGDLLPYLNPTGATPDVPPEPGGARPSRTARRVRDRTDLHTLLLPFEAHAAE